MNFKVLCLLLVSVSLYNAVYSATSIPIIGAGISAIQDIVTIKPIGQSSSSSSSSSPGSLPSNPLDQLLPLLPNVSWSIVNQSLVKTVDLPNISALAPVVQEAIQVARNLTLGALGGATDLASAITTAVVNAINDLNPVDALYALTNTILKIFSKVAASVPVDVAAAVIKDGLNIVTNIVKGLVPAILAGLALG